MSWPAETGVRSILIDNGQHGAHPLDTLLHGFSGTAGSLDGHGLQQRVLLQVPALKQSIDLHDFASQADDQDGTVIGIADIAG